jgi:hypothetical protein
MFVLLALTLCAVAQFANSSQVRRPEDVVRKLYRQIVERKPLGIPRGSDKSAIWPLLSKRLIQDLETARACEADGIRQTEKEEAKLRREHPDQAKMISLKPPTWDENGLFSGGNEEGVPARAIITKVAPQADGSFRVYVRLTYKETFETYGRRPNPADTFSWSVAAVVTSENAHYVVDDVVFFSDDSKKIETRLAQMLTQGCDGLKWIGNAGRTDK